jgi:hypothetical protein
MMVTLAAGVVITVPAHLFHPDNVTPIWPF